MTQYYSDPAREQDPHALPDVEVFYRSVADCVDQPDTPAPGWYYWFCFPGCLPDGEPFGPFNSEKDAVRDMYEHYSTQWTGEWDD